MKREVNLLVSSAGRRVGLIQCFRDSAEVLGIPFKVIATDMQPKMSAACQIADKHFCVPRCEGEAFVKETLGICKKEGIDIVVPTIDTELPIFAASKEHFLQEGVRVVVSDRDSVAFSASKMETVKKLKEMKVKSPKSMYLKDFIESPPKWEGPFILKPDSGSSSQGMMAVENVNMLAEMKGKEEYLIQEYWEGSEYTVNVFFDAKGRLRSVVPHLRYEVRGGEVSKGVTERRKEFEAIGKLLAKHVSGFYGPICFQSIIKATGELAVIEVNARFGGGYPLTHQAGAPFTQWLLEESLGIQPSFEDSWEDGLIMLRYDKALFQRKKKRESKKS